MAETIALAKPVVKIKHIGAQWFYLQCKQEQEIMINSTCVWVDNTAAIAAATGNDFTHETVKHVTVNVCLLQECVQSKISMKHQDRLWEFMTPSTLWHRPAPRRTPT
jgi:hypothetical protein